MFFKYNSALGPPYNVIVDTNFINFSIKNKLEVVSAMMDCLLAKCELSSASALTANVQSVYLRSEVLLTDQPLACCALL